MVARSRKKIMLLIILLGVGLTYVRYNNTLSQSKKSAQNIVARAVTDQETLDDREDSAEAETYREAQKKMEGEQQNIVQEIQKMQEDGSPITLASGSFNRLDAIHRAEGEVDIIEDGEDIYVILSPNFKTANGPDLFVILSNSSDIYEENSLNLGPLTNITGKQVYKITKEERDRYNGSLQIRCRAFDVLFSVASFR